MRANKVSCFDQTAVTIACCEPSSRALVALLLNATTRLQNANKADQKIAAGSGNNWELEL
jgi:hypothetical protein